MDSDDVPAEETSGRSNAESVLPPPPPDPPSPAAPRWYRRPWVVGVAALIVGALIGAGGAVPATDSSAEIAGRDSQIKQLSSERDSLAGENEDLLSEVASLRSEIAILENTVSRHESLSGELESEIADLESQVASLKSRLEQKQNPRNQQLFEVNLSEWEGLFRISGLSLKYDFGWEVLGEIEYLGGGDCPLGYVEVEATFFKGGNILYTAFTNYSDFPEGVPRNLEILTGEDQKPDHVRVTMAEAGCE